MPVSCPASFSEIVSHPPGMWNKIVRTAKTAAQIGDDDPAQNGADGELGVAKFPVL